MSDEVRIKRERILLSKIKERYTERQMDLWGTTNMIVGAIAITTVHVIMLLLGTSPLTLFWQVVLLFVLVPMSLLYYRQYRQTKVKSE